MSRVHTAIAAKDYPEHDIVKGEKYWFWTPYRSRKCYSATLPRPSQVESNGTRAAFYAASEGLADSIAKAESIEDLRAAIDDAINDLSMVAEELEEKASNIEEGFGHETEQSSLFTEQAEGVQDAIQQLQQIEVEEVSDDSKNEIDECLSGIDI